MGEYSDELDRYLQAYEEKIGKTLRVPEQLIQRKLINQSIESGRFSNPRKSSNGQGGFFYKWRSIFLFSRKTETRYRPNSFCIVKFRKFVLQ